MTNRSALVVDGDLGVRRLAGKLLRKLGCEVFEAEDGADALAKLTLGHFDVVVADLRTSLADGMQLLAAIAERQPGTPTITLTAEGSLSDCLAAIRAGAVDCLIKPIQAGTFESALRQALGDSPEPERTPIHPPPAPPPAPERTRRARPIWGDSPLMQEVLRIAGSVAPTDATVLITGEMGAGKDVVARLIHALSKRASGPLVTVHCSALPEGRIDSELYGHTRGAFPGADERRVGLLAQASGGTIILDEIGELPLRAQARLVRALEERAITPVGASHPVAIDVRVVAATHRDLEALCAIGEFREDLRYCLDVVHVDMPPLRARCEDIPPLVAHFLTLASRRLGRPLAITKDCLQALVRYRWPGNVRELKNTVDRMASLATGPSLDADLLPPRVRASAAASVRVTVAAAPAGIPDLHPELLERLRRKVTN